jgi:tetratricopeptide (TPR) repeat protein
MWSAKYVSMTAESQERKWQPILGLAVLVILVFAAYSPALRAGFIWDDDRYVTDNPLLKDPDGLQRIWFSQHNQSQYFPLVFTTLRMEYALWGLKPFGYHLVNITIHALNVVLIWRVLRKLLVPGAWIVAAIFAVHPVQVESVAWVTELKNTQSTFFFLLSLLFWIRFVEPKSNRPIYYATALVFYLLALFSKTTACTLPAALLIVLWLKRDPVTRLRVFQIAPFVFLGLAMGLFTMWWERHLSGFHLALGLAGRLLIASRAVWFYAFKIVWPTNLAFSYPLWNIETSSLFSYGWLALCLAALYLLWRKRRVLNRAALCSLFFFVATLSPMLGLISLYTFRYSYVADHYQYLACVGLIALAVAGGAVVVKRFKFPRQVQAAAVALLLGVFSVATWQRCVAFHDPESLWHDTIAKNPASWMAYNNLGFYLFGKDRTDEAIVNYRKAISLKADHAEAHYNLGLALAKQGSFPEAIAEHTEALRINPLYVKAEYQLGYLFLRAQRVGEAETCFRKTLELQSDFLPALFNLGVLLIQKGDSPDGAALLERAMRQDPNMSRSVYALANNLAGHRQFGGAILCYEAILRVQPEYFDARMNLGNALAASGKPDAAIDHYKLLLKDQPQNLAAYNNLGLLLASRSRVEEAVDIYSRALVREPTSPELQFNLGLLLMRQGRTLDASNHFVEALRLKPDFEEARQQLAKLK